MPSTKGKGQYILDKIGGLHNGTDSKIFKGSRNILFGNS